MINQQNSEILWQDPSRINHYFTDFLTFEQMFFMWFLYVSPFWELNPKYLETPVRRLPSLLNDICSVIESISKDINFYLDKQFDPEFYVDKEQIRKDARIFQVQNYYSLTHDYLKNNSSNIPALNNFNNELNNSNKTRLLINNIGISTSDYNRNITNPTPYKQVKENRMHYDFDYLAHIDFRLGISDKKVQLRTDIIPIDLAEYPFIQYPLKHAHESESYLAKGERRPTWCTVYQGTKHALADHYQECNGLVVLEALGALYILCMFAKYLPKTKMLKSPDAPEIGSFPLEDLSNGSLLFKPTITHTTFHDLSKNLNNKNLVEYKTLPESMFIIKNSESYFKIMLNKQFTNNQQLAEQFKTQQGIVDLLSSLPSSVFEESGLQPKVVLNTYCHYKITDIVRKKHKVSYKKQLLIDSIYNYRNLTGLRSN